VDGPRSERSGVGTPEPTSPELPAGTRCGTELRVTEGVVTVPRLPRVPLQGFGAPTVATRLDLQLVVNPGTGVRVPARLRYDARDPYAVFLDIHVGSYAVFLDIHVGSDEPIVWTFARELLATGSREWAGVGDVTVHPGAGGTGSVYVSLRGVSGGAVLRARSSDVGGFLWRTERLVPIGSEREHFDLDLLLCRLLRHPAPSRAETCGCCPRGRGGG
jgi:hypothetical protein